MKKENGNIILAKVMMLRCLDCYNKNKLGLEKKYGMDWFRHIKNDSSGLCPVILEGKEKEEIIKELENSKCLTCGSDNLRYSYSLK